MAPLIRRLDGFGLYSQTIYNFSIREFPRYHCSFRRLRLPGAGFSVRFQQGSHRPRAGHSIATFLEAGWGSRSGGRRPMAGRNAARL